MNNIPAIPEPSALTLAEARDVCVSVINWANECDDVEMVVATKKAFQVVAEDVDGVSYMQVFEAFKSSSNPDDLAQLGAEQVDELLRKWAKDIVDGMRKNSNGQLSFEGIGEFDDTVTTLNAEGGYVVKRLRFATKADLLVDESIHDANVRKATEALERARKRNLRLIPLMEDHGYDTAGDALDHLEQLTQGG